MDDYHAGDMVCSHCGLVVAERVIDVGSEWRTFSNDPNARDMSRVGAAENELPSAKKCPERQNDCLRFVFNTTMVRFQKYFLENLADMSTVNISE